MAGWQIIGNRYPFTYTKPPESFVLERTDHSMRITYVPESIGRCGDCKWARPDQSDHDFRDQLVCTRMGAGVEPHDFCSHWLWKEDE